MIRSFQGNMPELIPLLEKVVTSLTLTTVDYPYLSALAMARAFAGDRRGAASALAQLCQHGQANLPRTCNWLTMMPGVVATARLLGDVEVSREAYGLLVPYAHRPMMAGPVQLPPPRGKSPLWIVSQPGEDRQSQRLRRE
jgi:hypothetical protein